MLFPFAKLLLVGKLRLSAATLRQYRDKGVFLVLIQARSDRHCSARLRCGSSAAANNTAIRADHVTNRSRYGGLTAQPCNHGPPPAAPWQARRMALDLLLWQRGHRLFQRQPADVRW